MAKGDKKSVLGMLNKDQQKWLSTNGRIKDPDVFTKLEFPDKTKRVLGPLLSALCTFHQAPRHDTKRNACQCSTSWQAWQEKATSISIYDPKAGVVAPRLEPKDDSHVTPAL
ncbi:hypothetical protein VNO80_06104 [Phaseolus coccineus]|uniref:Uncharacterized protein n=1 Tax=Phaseolus coccineus TaxID=3886 RepID=A0AAN9NH49_PHACN